MERRRRQGRCFPGAKPVVSLTLCRTNRACDSSNAGGSDMGSSLPPLLRTPHYKYFPSLQRSSKGDSAPLSCAPW